MNASALASESPSSTTTQQEGFQRWRCWLGSDLVPIARQHGSRRVLFCRLRRAVESYQRYRSQMPAGTRTRTRTRTNTNPNDTKANAAGRRGVRVRSAKGMCENQGAWAAKCLKKREALVGGVHSGNAHRKAPDLRNTKFHYSRGQKRLFSAQGA